MPTTKETSPETDPLAGMTDTGKTIKHRGVTYRILTPHDSRADSPYVLVAPVGRLHPQAPESQRSLPDHP